MSINFFTTANKEYEHFVLPYIFSILYNVPSSFVEIAVDDAARFLKENESALKTFNWNGYYKYYIRQKDTFEGKKIVENTKRFLMTPTIKADIYYVGDIDIFIFDNDIEQFHKLQMMRTGACYSNIVRPGSKRLTGLHVCTDLWFWITNRIRKDIITDFCLDEHALYNIAEVCGKPEYVTSGNCRPVHGLHLSPNRTPDSAPPWNVNSYGEKMIKFIETDEWGRISSGFDRKYLELIEKVKEWYEGYKK